MNDKMPTPQTERPVQTPSPFSQNEPEGKRGLLKVLGILEVGVIEVLFVGTVTVLLFGTLNYFNILSVSTLWPNQLGFLPHQKQNNNNVAIVTAVSPTQQAKETLPGVLPNILAPVLIPQEKVSIEEITLDMPEPPQFGLSFSGTIPPGEKKQHVIPLEGGIRQVVFPVVVSDRTVVIGFQGPLKSDSASLKYVQDAEGLVKTYVLVSPKAGDYIITLSTPKSISVPVSYQVITMIAGDVVLYLETYKDPSRDIYVLPGEKVQITAHLDAVGKPIVGAIATASIIDPEGKKSVVPLVDNNNGTYDLFYSPPPDKGERYGVDIVVDGEYQGSKFTRKNTIAFWMTRGTPLGGIVNLEGRSDHYGAQVSTAPGDFSTLTARDGSFAFLRVPPGAYKIKVSMPDYLPAARKYEAQDSVDANILPPVTLLRADLHKDKTESLWP